MFPPKFSTCLELGDDLEMLSNSDSMLGANHSPRCSMAEPASSLGWQRSWYDQWRDSGAEVSYQCTRCPVVWMVDMGADKRRSKCFIMDLTTT